MRLVPLRYSAVLEAGHASAAREAQGIVERQGANSSEEEGRFACIAEEIDDRPLR